MSQGRPNIDRLKRKRVVAELVRALRHDDVGVQLDAAKALNELDKERPLTWEPTDAHEQVLLLLTRPGPVDEEELNSRATEVMDTLAACLEHIAADDRTSNRWRHRYEGRIGPLLRTLIAADPDRAVELLIRLFDADVMWGEPLISTFDALGDPRTVAPLLKMVREGVGEKALMALEHVIERSGPAVPAEVLESVVALKDEKTYRAGFSADLHKGTLILTVKAVALAQEELVRRHSPEEADAMRKAREERTLSLYRAGPKNLP